MDQTQSQLQMMGIQLRWYHGFQNIFYLREVMHSGIEQAIDNFRAKYTDHLSNQLGDVENNQYYLNGIEMVAASGTETAVERAQLISDAAALVFAHTLLDSAVKDYLKVTFWLDPEAWERLVRNEVIELTIEEIRENKVEEHIRKRMEATYLNSCAFSLPKKVRQLHEICKSKGLVPKIDTYSYKETELKRLDEAQKSIANGNGLNIKATEENFDSDLRFLFTTAEYCQMLVCKRFNLWPPDYIFSRKERFFDVF
ncbi:MAG: hypothetical protein JWN14_329 [Chthonomonadales bacterium]|nr:hypothetical protein [Chthonomonadales bacterium]